ncbi:MAG: DEAD/DEAH box helicase [Planctomycetes bacterium]|nr:DEAD/DEAH box helicase [Planctomycetota bacterium]
MVADARFVTRMRAFPRRELTAEDLLTALGDSGCMRGVAIRTLVAGRRLAGFQRRATVRILGELERGTASGTVVCAGTGSGKTLAFYLPALTHIAELLDGSDWVRCLAIYPRNELLKDQFTEAYRQCRSLRGALAAAGRRPLRLGALFGPTPRSVGAFDSPWPPGSWHRAHGGYVCPLLRCPDCGGDMVWRDADRDALVERLQCTTCNTTTGPEEVVITRDRLRQCPPDVLFTTTEMLNQRMSDSRFGKLFGVGQPAERKPRLLLLDEVHTYSGTSGAQTAFLLRRWQHAARCRPHVVGLSATLRDAPRFFATLTGLPPVAVEEVSARPDELEPRGTEYLLALRGDPAAGTSLLSVSIQAAMLLARVLDPRDGSSGGLFGRKLFAFTDDLDVTNRLFFNLRDAEGQDSWGNPKRGNPTGSLANLRASTSLDASERFRDGQSWDLCEWVGHPLRPNSFTRVGRTSSQDAGVDQDADQIVATAALEVGFNDPAVGAVLQHKAPIDPAAFLQRRGRAGRDPRMRPWTVVVLSDYGRDRLAYQAYDLLFDPELPARELPIANRHVRRMQAVFATIDWLGFQLEGHASGSVWQDVSVPVDARSEYERENVKKRQQRIAQLAEAVLARPEQREDLSTYLRAALRLSAEEVELLLWESPRPLLTVVFPTLLRRLRTQWRRVVSGGLNAQEFHEHNAPLPEFVPRALFQDLSVPEVTVVTPPQQRGEEARRDAMRVGQALTEFAPGRVSRRFGVKHRYARHWVEPPSLSGERDQVLLVSRFVPTQVAEALGVFEMLDAEGRVIGVPCVRPWEIHAAVPPRNVIDSSNAYPEWRTQIVPLLDGVSVVVPPKSAWAQLVAEVSFFTHATNCPVEVRRFALGCEASIGFEDGTRFEPRIRFVGEDGRQAAVGFAHDADAVVLRLRLPADLPATIAAQPDLLRVLRSAIFRYRVRTNQTLDGVVNVFGRDWLAQAFVLACVGQLSAGGEVRAVAEGLPVAALRAALDVLFGAVLVGAGENGAEADPNHDAAPPVQQKAHLQLLDALSSPVVINTLRAAASALWESPGLAWAGWLRAALKATAGAAAVDAIVRLCPDVDAREVLVDIDCGPRPAGATVAPADLEEVWLTETAVGGGGVLEKFQQRYGEDPRRFFELMSRALEPGDFETADAELWRLLEAATGSLEPALATAVSEVRTARLRTHAELGRAFDGLLAQLRVREFAVTHPVVAALAGRVLRAGTSGQSDRLLYDLLSRWRDLETRVGFEVDARTFAWLASADEDVGDVLSKVVGTPLLGRSARSAAVSGLLWPRGSDVWGQRLRVRNPFAELPWADRRLLLAGLPPPLSPILLNESDALERLGAALLDGGVAVAAGNAATARETVLRFAADAIDTGLLLAYPRVRAMNARGGTVTVEFELPEATP